MYTRRCTTSDFWGLCAENGRIKFAFATLIPAKCRFPVFPESWKSGKMDAGHDLDQESAAGSIRSSHAIALVEHVVAFTCDVGVRHVVEGRPASGLVPEPDHGRHA